MCLPYMGMESNLGHVAKPIFNIIFVHLSNGGAKWNLALIGEAVSEKMMFKNNGHIHIYSPRAGVDNPLESKFYHKHKS